MNYETDRSKHEHDLFVAREFADKLLGALLAVAVIVYAVTVIAIEVF
jgi:hypothetical protein